MDKDALKKLISELPIDAANVEHIAKTGKINGSLLMSIVGLFDYYEKQKWAPASTPPEVGDRYNVIQDLEDGEDPITHTAEYHKPENKWYEIGCETECIGILFWQPLPDQNMVTRIDTEQR